MNWAAPRCPSKSPIFPQYICGIGMIFEEYVVAVISRIGSPLTTVNRRYRSTLRRPIMAYSSLEWSATEAGSMRGLAGEEEGPPGLQSEWQIELNCGLGAGSTG